MGAYSAVVDNGAESGLPRILPFTLYTCVVWTYTFHGLFTYVSSSDGNPTGQEQCLCMPAMSFTMWPTQVQEWGSPR